MKKVELDFCDKCKKPVDERWLSSKLRTDGSTKETWICTECLSKSLTKEDKERLEKILEIVPKE